VILFHTRSHARLAFHSCDAASSGFSEPPLGRLTLDWPRNSRKPKHTNGGDDHSTQVVRVQGLIPARRQTFMSRVVVSRVADIGVAAENC
jgi:hypothetical protein